MSGDKGKIESLARKSRARFSSGRDSMPILPAIGWILPAPISFNPRRRYYFRPSPFPLTSSYGQVAMPPSMNLTSSKPAASSILQAS